MYVENDCFYVLPFLLYLNTNLIIEWSSWCERSKISVFIIFTDSKALLPGSCLQPMEARSPQQFCSQPSRTGKPSGSSARSGHGEKRDGGLALKGFIRVIPYMSSVPTFACTRFVYHRRSHRNLFEVSMTWNFQLLWFILRNRPNSHPVTFGKKIYSIFLLFSFLEDMAEY